jgi:hypothetical protein
MPNVLPLFVLLPAISRRPSKRVLVAVLATVCGVLLLVAVGCYCVWRTRRKRRRSEMAASAPSGAGDVLPFRVRKDQWLGDEEWQSAEKDVDLPLIDLAVILTGTDNFATRAKIGEGGFGPVYRVSRVIQITAIYKPKHKRIF